MAIATVLAVVIGGVAGLLWPEPEHVPPYPRPRPDIQVWDGSLPKPEGMR